MSIRQAFAEGNAMGKGPVVLHLPQSAISAIRELAATGEEAFIKLQNNMYRCVGKEAGRGNRGLA